MNPDDRTEPAPGPPMRLNAAARLLGCDRRTLLKYRDQLGIFRVGWEYRVPAAAIDAVRSGRLALGGHSVRPVTQ